MINAIVGMVDAFAKFFGTNIKKFTAFLSAIVTVVLFSLTSTASAQDAGGDVTKLTSVATGGIEQVKTAVIAIAVVAVSIALVRWAASKVKPRG